MAKSTVAAPHPDPRRRIEAQTSSKNARADAAVLDEMCQLADLQKWGRAQHSKLRSGGLSNREAPQSRRRAVGPRALTAPEEAVQGGRPAGLRRAGACTPYRHRARARPSRNHLPEQ